RLLARGFRSLRLPLRPPREDAREHGRTDERQRARVTTDLDRAVVGGYARRGVLRESSRWARREPPAAREPAREQERYERGARDVPRPIDERVRPEARDDAEHREQRDSLGRVRAHPRACRRLHALATRNAREHPHAARRGGEYPR